MRPLLILLMFICLLPAPLYAQGQPYACESQAVFVEPGSEEAREYVDYHPLAWQGWQKQKIDYAFEMVKSLAPALVANACIAGKIRLVNCGRVQDDLLQSYLTEIYFYPKFWNDITRINSWKLADMLAHELTHMVDNGDNLSRSSDWKVYTHDRVVECRKALAKRKQHADSTGADFVAQGCGLPSAYCIKAPPESLAESVSAKLFNRHFQMPLDMAEFVEKRVLAQQPYTHYNELMHESWSAELQRDFERAAAGYRQALVLDPLSVRARQGLVSCLIHQHKIDDATNELKKLQAQLHQEADLSSDHAELNGVRGMLAKLKQPAP